MAFAFAYLPLIRDKGSLMSMNWNEMAFAFAYLPLIRDKGSLMSMNWRKGERGIASALKKILGIFLSS